ncbi:MAG: Holliday junction resolvase RuvX [Hydrogenibacillus schlegelii]|nr:Holliday junction resolvase RuvX [Hydrogenibacillus schlegelii]
MRIMALDVGTKTIGVALSDPLGITAQALETVRRSGGGEFDRLGALIARHGVEAVVVGLPKNLDNTPGKMAEQARAVGRHIARRFGLPVIYWDERLTTVAAERVLLEADLSRRRRKDVIDALAAQFILQHYLDARRAQGGPPQ